MQKHILLALFLFTGVFSAKSQVVDSLIVSTEMYCSSSSHNFLNLGDNGILLFGVKSNPKSGLSYFTNTFLIQQYDTSFKLTGQTIELDNKVLSPEVSENNGIVFFLLPSELSAAAYLVIYDTRLMKYEVVKFATRWKNCENFKVYGTAHNAYFSYTKTVAASMGVMTNEWHMEVLNYSIPGAELVDLTPDDIEGFQLNSINFLNIEKEKDVLYAEYDYLSLSADKINPDKKFYLRAFNGRKNLFEADGTQDPLFNSTTTVKECDGHISFYTLLLDHHAVQVSETIIINGNMNTRNTNLMSSSDCKPGSYVSRMIVKSGDKYIIASQHVTSDENLDKPFMITIQKKGITTFDTTIKPFTKEEMSLLPAPFMSGIQVIGNTTYFFVSSWQKLNCYSLDEKNEFVFLYSVHLPIQREIGGPSIDFSKQSFEAWRARMELLQSFRIDFANKNHLIAYSIFPSVKNKGLTLKLYRCAF
ncbi:hypothetical protein BH11BAC7_BH11BAC7_13780 [soil metagenome]